MCDCLRQVDEKLAEKNATVSTKLMMNFKTGEAWAALYVPVEKIDSKIRKPLPALIASFCPFCGEKDGQRNGSKSKSKLKKVTSGKTVKVKPSYHTSPAAVRRGV